MGWTCQDLTKEVVVLCEGIDEVRLLDEMAKHLGLEAQFIDCGGREQFHLRIKVVMKARGYARVRVLGVIRDAEDDAAATQASVIGRLRDEGLPVPTGPLMRAPGTPDTSFLIVPHGRSSGMMEDLILDALASEPSRPCHDSFFDCLQEAGIDIESDHRKRRVQALLAALPSDHLARSIGEAAQKGLLPFDHQALSEIRDFLMLVAN